MEPRRIVIGAGGLVALVALVALLRLGPGGGSPEDPSRQPAPTAGEARGVHPATGRAEGTAPDAAELERRAGRQALAAAEQALALLGRNRPDALSRRDALRLALDPEASRLERVQALRVLGRLSDAEALDVIERVLRDEPSDALRFQAAAALGASRGPTADRLLDELLAGDDLAARLGAIEALGTRGSEGDAARLEALMLDPGEETATRQAALDALSGLGGPEAVTALGRILAEETDEALLEGAIEGLAAQPWQESEELVRALLQDPALDPDREIALLEGLADSSAGAAPLLTEYASSAPRPETRRAAVESLALLEEAPGVANELRRLADEESDPAVRAELYDALALHADWDDAGGDAALAGRVLEESDPQVRLRGERMVAARVRRSADAGLAETFDQEIVPSLADRAADPDASRYDRLMSVDALKLAGTSRSRDALASLADSRDPVIASSAEKALAFPARR